MSTKLGRQAEAVAAQWLISHHFSIITKNWRSRFCEVDVIAQKNGCLYFVEVKYRSSNNQGGGLDYITNKKLGQMEFAANLFMAKYKLPNSYQLCALSVGPKFEVEEFVELEA